MTGHGQDHDHDHPHAEIGQSEKPGHYDVMESAVREPLIEKRLFGADEIRRQIEVLDLRTPALGAKVVARAWVDADFRPTSRGWPRRWSSALASMMIRL